MAVRLDCFVHAIACEGCGGPADLFSKPKLRGKRSYGDFLGPAVSCSFAAFVLVWPCRCAGTEPYRTIYVEFLQGTTDMYQY